MKFDLATRCLVGSAGQDRVFARVFDEIAILAVADGAGGRAGGAEAAQIVAQEAEMVAQTAKNPRDANFWAQWLGEVDELIRNDSNAGETTALIAAMGAICLTERQIRKLFLGQGATAIPFSSKLRGETLFLASDGLTKYASQETIAEIGRGENLEVVAEELIKIVRYSSGVLPDDFSCILCRCPGENAPEKRRWFR